MSLAGFWWFVVFWCFWRFVDFVCGWLCVGLVGVVWVWWFGVLGWRLVGSKR